MLEPVIDLHADVLSYIVDGKGRSFYDLASRASYEQLLSGGVALQVFPIFTRTAAGSVEYAARQAEVYQTIQDQFDVIALQSANDLAALGRGKLLIGAAIENASGICEENEDIQSAIARLEKVSAKLGPLLYLSLTWNGENRFGGGCGTSVGLKADGKTLLQYLSKKQIPVDLSHASDQLAFDVLEQRRNDPSLLILASHSNFRALCNVERNLPDSIATKIIRLGGLIGLNSIEEFLGADSIEMLAKHVAHGISLGGVKNLAFGSDFFCDSDIPADMMPLLERPMFLTEWQSSADFPSLSEKLRKRINPSDDFIISNLSARNAYRFFSRVLG